ncbi:MAG: sensor histidine kinase, partial [Gammaproteobacteria bacterium]
GSELNPIWVYQYLAGIFIFVLLVGDWLICILLWIITVTPFLIFGFTVEFEEPSAFMQAWILPAPVYLSAVIVCALSNRNSEIINRERLLAASRLGTYIAHELRTPLATTNLLCRALLRKISSPAPTNSVDSGSTKLLLEEELRRMVIRTLVGIQEETRYSNTIIDILLRNVSPLGSHGGSEDKFLVSSMLHETLRRFPFSGDREKRLLSVLVVEDFPIQGSFEMMVNVCLNLLRNALYFAQSRRGGELRVIAGRFGGFSSLVVTDSGPGICEKDRQRVFDLFFSRSPSGQGAGIGLSFCKSVMESIGGQITCESKEGEYTTFRLLFPQPKSGTDAPHSA